MIVVAFAFLNAAEVGGINVLGPVVAEQSLGGAASWGLIVTAQTIGLIAAGFVMLRWRPRESCSWGRWATAGAAPLFALLAVHAPVWVIAAAALSPGVGLETFGVLWDTAMQQQIPQDRLSRVSSYDALGSFVFIPIGAVRRRARWRRPSDWKRHSGRAPSLVLLCTLSMLAVGDVRSLRRTPAEPYTEAEARSAAAS